jgi:prevent-host-death family protein
MKYLTFGVRDLQAHIGKALRLVAQGERIQVTSHGKVVAVIGASDTKLSGESAVDRKLRRLAAQGRLRLGKPGKIRPYKLPKISGLTEQLLADRE